MVDIRGVNRVLARNEDVILFRGDTHDFQFELTDACGEGPFDLTGWTAKLAAKTNLDHPTVAWEVTGTSPSAGVVVCTVTETEIAAVGHFVAELRLINDADPTRVVTVLQFAIGVVKDVT